MGKFSVDTKLGDLYKNKASREVLEKYQPGCSKDPRARTAYGLSYREMANYPQAGISAEMLEAVDKDLRAIE